MSSSTILSYMYRPQTFFKERQFGVQNLSRIVKNVIPKKALCRHQLEKIDRSCMFDVRTSKSATVLSGAEAQEVTSIKKKKKLRV